ncbi:MAG: response regulator [Flavobacterium sp.]|nr:response regulator [Flavobacterium sp.]
MNTEISQQKCDRVMVIDDNEIDMFITSRIIENSNFTKTILKYLMPEKALLFLKENQQNLSVLPQIIFLDIHMPLMDGFEFLEHYMQLSDTLKSNCKVFIVSSTCDNMDIAKVQNEKNIEGFQEKPITTEFLKGISGYCSALD